MKSKTCKACPHCQSPAPLTAQQCLTCGHAYRTLFVPAAPMTPPTQLTRKIIVSEKSLYRQRELSPVQTSLLFGFMILFIGGINMVLQTSPSGSSSHHWPEIARKHFKPRTTHTPIMINK